jgi:hypothetical protein
VEVILDHGDHGVLDDLLFCGELGRHLLLELLGQPAHQWGSLYGICYSTVRQTPYVRRIILLSAFDTLLEVLPTEIF